MCRIENYFSHGKKVPGTPFKNSQGKNKFKMRFSWLCLSNLTLTSAAGKFNINSNLHWSVTLQQMAVPVVICAWFSAHGLTSTLVQTSSGKSGTNFIETPYIEIDWWKSRFSVQGSTTKYWFLVLKMASRMFVQFCQMYLEDFVWKSIWN